MVEERQRGSKPIHQYLLQQKVNLRFNRLSCNVVTSNVKCHCFHVPGHLTQLNPHGSTQTIFHIYKFQILSILCFATLSVLLLTALARNFTESWESHPDLHWPFVLSAKGTWWNSVYTLWKHPPPQLEPVLVESCLSSRPSVVQNHHLVSKEKEKPIFS